MDSKGTQPSIHKHACSVASAVPDFAIPVDHSRQAPLSMRFSRQDYWSGLLCHPPGNLPDQGTEPTSPVSPTIQADSLPLSHRGSPTTHIHVSILPQTLLPFTLPYNTEQSSLCYPVGYCWLSILNIAVCTCQSQPL